MTLRTRLIVAFLVVSVVPLGVVTFYSYTSNVRALQQDGAHEADMLAGQLSDRMQLVTAQLSDRVERLMDMPVPEPATQTVKPVKPTPVKPTPAAPAPAQAAVPTLNDQIASALGEAAILLNNVDLPGIRGGPGQPSRPPGTATSFYVAGREPTGRGRTGAGREAAAGVPPAAVPPATGQTPPAAAVQAPAAPVRPVAPDVPRFSPARPQGQRFRPGRSGTGVTPPATGAIGAPPAAQPPTTPGTGPAPPAAPGEAGGPTSAAGTAAGDRMKIDLAPIRRELYRQIVPQGQTEALTPEEHQRIIREVNQRMLGIVQGIKLSATELQKKADEARQKASADAAKSETATQGLKAAASAIGASVAQTVASAVSAATAEAVPSAPVTRHSALTGNQLNVTMEQNGKVVRNVNAEVNLPNLLMTVFSSTRSEQGEVPFAVAKDGTIYAPSDADKQKVEALGPVARPDGPIGTTVLADWIVVTTSDPTGSGLRFGIARPYADSLGTLRRTAERNAAFGLLIIGVAIVGIVPLSSRLTRNLSTLTEGVRRIAHGDYRARVAVKSQDEVGLLAQAFNQMAEDVERHQRAVVEQERLKRELELGRQIQHDMLPHEPLRLGLTEINGVSVPAREVGGDFFNYFALPNGHLALLVGDVSGKGVGAALLMANVQASLRTRFSLGQDLSAIAEELDREIHANSPGPLYATLFVATLDTSSRRLRYVNAGHHPQFVLRRGGGLDHMHSTGLPVGLLAGYGYRQIDVQLAEGDVLFFYTDGCVEAENDAGDMFGTERLEEVLASCTGAGPDEILKRVERAVKDFRGARELFDDETMMAVKVG